MKQKALENFLNTEVTKLKSGVYQWRERFYEVKYYRYCVADHQQSHFIKWEFGGKVWGIREVSEDLLKRLLTK